MPIRRWMTHLIPTGELRPVAGTVFDFRTPRVIAARIRDGSEPQLAIGRGYDHNFVAARARRAACAWLLASRIRRSGRVLELLTTEPEPSALHRQLSLRRRRGQGLVACIGKAMGSRWRLSIFRTLPTIRNFRARFSRPGALDLDHRIPLLDDTIGTG